MKLKPGKLPPEFLNDLIQGLVLHREVTIGPGIGFDSAVIDLGDKFLVVTSDPITFVAEDIGYYTVAVNINDVAVTGAEPAFMTLTVLIPEKGMDLSGIKKVFEDVREVASEYGISIVGGHTEVSPGIENIVTSATMIGFADKDELVRQDGARPGDIVVMAGFAGVEATSIIARELDLRKYFTEDEISEMKNFYKNPGIVILERVRCLKRYARPTAMHDPTEGGVAQAIHELAVASDVGFLIESDRIPVHPYTTRLSQILDFDPLGIISSGSLIATVKPEDVSRIHCPDTWIIGKVVDKSGGVKMVHRGKVTELPEYPQDEITRILD